MPEGDTIYRAARSLRAAIAGRRVEGWRSDVPALMDADLVGRTVERVEARGKNLLVVFDDGRTLHTHMMMNGSWHLYRPGERWRRSGRVQALIETDEWLAICFDAPLCQLYRAGREPKMVRELGPDLLDDAPDLDEAVRRLRARPELPLGVALMTQRLVSGIGNVYKSEVLFLERLDPFEPVEVFDDEALHRLLARARKLMLRNLRGGPRTTRRRFSGGRVWVYDRSGEPCFECGAPVEMRRQGQQVRSTYYCPACQRAGDAARI